MLQPQFYVKFTNETTKNGDSITYKLKLKKLGGGNNVSGGDNTVTYIERDYDDFEFLHHTLTTQNRLDGLIVPPLPPRKALDPARLLDNLLLIPDFIKRP